MLKTERNEFFHAATDLILTYSIAIAASLFSVILAMAESGAAYSNDFSTVVKTTRHQKQLDYVVRNERDKSGAEPRPEGIADAYVVMVELQHESSPPVYQMGQV